MARSCYSFYMARAPGLQLLPPAPASPGLPSCVHLFPLSSSSGLVSLRPAHRRCSRPAGATSATRRQGTCPWLCSYSSSCLLPPPPAPPYPQASTPVSLKATAGLRLLPGDKADNILDAVRQFLATYPFSLAPDAVAILGGRCCCLGRGDGGREGWKKVWLQLGAVREAWAASEGLTGVPTAAVRHGWGAKVTRGGGELPMGEQVLITGGKD